MQYNVEDRVRWIVHSDEPERTGTIYEADHELDYYSIKVDLWEGETIQMSSGMPGRNILGLIEPEREGDNVVSLAKFKMRNGR